MKWRGRTWLQGPQVPQPGPVGQVARWSETIVAFARLCLCGGETAIAFAGEKWAFLVRFSGAEVMAVSVVPCWGCAVVLLVSTSPCFCVLCATLFTLLGLVWVRARKSSPYVLTMAKNWRLMARWASIFADQQSWDPAGRVCCTAGLVAALLLAVLTLQCAAKPTWWPMGSTAHAPLGGLTCA